MNFSQAYLAMRKGKRIRREPWEGYWAWEDGTIMMHCQNGDVIDIRQTANPSFTFDNIATNDWEIIEGDYINEVLRDRILKCYFSSDNQKEIRQILIGILDMLIGIQHENDELKKKVKELEKR